MGAAAVMNPSIPSDGRFVDVHSLRMGSDVLHTKSGLWRQAVRLQLSPIFCQTMDGTCSLGVEMLDTADVAFEL